MEHDQVTAVLQKLWEELCVPDVLHDICHMWLNTVRTANWDVGAAYARPSVLSYEGLDEFRDETLGVRHGLAEGEDMLPHDEISDTLLDWSHVREVFRAVMYRELTLTVCCMRNEQDMLVSYIYFFSPAAGMTQGYGVNCSALSSRAQSVLSLLLMNCGALFQTWQQPQPDHMCPVDTFADFVFNEVFNETFPRKDFLRMLASIVVSTALVSEFTDCGCKLVVAILSQILFDTTQQYFGKPMPTEVWEMYEFARMLRHLLQHDKQLASAMCDIRRQADDSQ
jgi:hypothetical protein